MMMMMKENCINESDHDDDSLKRKLYDDNSSQPEQQTTTTPVAVQYARCCLRMKEFTDRMRHHLRENTTLLLASSRHNFNNHKGDDNEKHERTKASEVQIRLFINIFVLLCLFVFLFPLLYGSYLRGHYHWKYRHLYRGNTNMKTPMLSHISRSYQGNLSAVPSSRYFMTEFVDDLQNVIDGLYQQPVSLNPLNKVQILWRTLPTLRAILKEKRENHQLQRIVVDPFPPTFDKKVYRDQYLITRDQQESKVDTKVNNKNNERTRWLLNHQSHHINRRSEILSYNSRDLTNDHYQFIGREFGFICSTGQMMRTILHDQIIVPILKQQQLYSSSGLVLEIGPYLTPVIRRDHPTILKWMSDYQRFYANNYGDKEHPSPIRYFDVLDTTGLRKRAVQNRDYGIEDNNLNHPLIRKSYDNYEPTIHIDYVNEYGQIPQAIRDENEKREQQQQQQTVLDDNDENIIEHVDGASTFGLIVSSFVVQIQRDLIHHLQQVGYLLQDGGYYVAIIPDKRYTADHYLPITTIADVLSDFFEPNDDDDDIDYHEDGKYNHYKKRIPTLSSYIEQNAYPGHGDTARYWKGDGGPMYPTSTGRGGSGTVAERITTAIQQYEAIYRPQKNELNVTDADEEMNPWRYAPDIHHYKFTPQSLALLIDTLYELDLIDVHVHRLYETVYGSNEFTIVLKRCIKV